MKYFLYAILFIILSCYTQKQSNFDISEYEGIDLEGKSVVLSNLPEFRRIALNVYSPTCVPCVKEIPALNYLHSEMKRENLGAFFMVVDPYNVTAEEDSVPFEEVSKKAAEIMKREVVEKKIDLPVLIMKKPFKVEPKNGLITGTPETLLFKTKPLILYYNFIGAINESGNLEEIKKDNKVNFFKKVIGGI